MPGGGVRSLSIRVRTESQARIDKRDGSYEKEVYRRFEVTVVSPDQTLQVEEALWKGPVD